MLSLNYAILADSAKVREGLLHIIAGGITQVNLAQIPGPLNASLALRFTGDKQDCLTQSVVEVRFIDQDGRQMPNLPVIKGTMDSIDIGTAIEGNLDVVLEMQSIMLVSTGQFFIDVLLNGKSVRRLPLNVVLAKAA
jgi:hypothetical protein